MLLSVLAAAEDVQNCLTLCGKAYEESCVLPAAPTNNMRSKQILQEVFFALLRASYFYIADKYLQHAFLSCSAPADTFQVQRVLRTRTSWRSWLNLTNYFPLLNISSLPMKKKGELGWKQMTGLTRGSPQQPRTCDARITARGGSKRLQEERATLVPMGETGVCSQSLQSLQHSSRLQQSGLWKKNGGCRRKKDKARGGKNGWEKKMHLEKKAEEEEIIWINCKGNVSSDTKMWLLPLSLRSEDDNVSRTSMYTAWYAEKM